MLGSVQVVAGAGAVAAGVWVVHHFLWPPVRRWWHGRSEPSVEAAAAAAVAGAIQAQVRLMHQLLINLAMHAGLDAQLL